MPLYTVGDYTQKNELHPIIIRIIVKRGGRIIILPYYSTIS